MSQTTIDELVTKHAALLDRARAILYELPSCRTSAEVEATMRRVREAFDRAEKYLDETIEMLRAGRDDLPRA